MAIVGLAAVGGVAASRYRVWMLALVVALQVGAVALNLLPWGIALVAIALALVVSTEPVGVVVAVGTVSVVALLLTEQLAAGWYASVPSFTQLVLILALGVAVGLAMRQSIYSKAAAAARMEAGQQQAIAEERLRLARELHDSVAHHLAAINIQAAAAQRLLDDSPADARDALSNVGSSARRALGELHEVVDTLRTGDDPVTWTALGADLSELVERHRGDLEVRVEEAREVDPAPRLVHTAALRIIAEALTNASKYAHGATVDVVMREERKGIAVKVRDRGGVPIAEPGLGGHGVVGMQERARRLGGWCRAEPTSDGFEVEAWLPGTEDQP
jgi:signal transduction histidine kinase